MSAGASSPTTGGHPLKNVIIGVITTVISATVIYFLGFHSPESDEFKKSKQATIDAWNSLQLYEKEFQDKATSMACAGTENTSTGNLLTEYEKIIKNINNIHKEEYVDNRLMSLIDRRVSTLEDKKAATADYYRQIDSFANDASDPRLVKANNDFLEKIKDLETQDTSFIKNVNAELKKKYKVDFKFPSPIVITPEFLAGNWTVDQVVNLSLNKNDKLTMKDSAESYSGKWTLNDLTLHFKFDDGSSFEYIIQRASQTFMYAVDSSGAGHYFCR